MIIRAYRVTFPKRTFTLVLAVVLMLLLVIVYLYLSITTYRPVSPNSFFKDFLKNKLHKCKNTSLTIDKPDKNLNYPQLLKDTMDMTLEPLPGEEELCTMSASQLEALYFRYITTIQKPCRKLLRLGNAKDGGWETCLEEGRLKRNSCLVYSFGINFDFSFDDKIRDFMGCEVHSFDPSMNMTDHVHKSGVSFHAIGLGHYDGIIENPSPWKMRTYETIRKDLGHTKRPPDILKMDIENWEFLTLPSIIHSHQLNGTDQLLVELHAYPFYSLMSTKGYWRLILLFLRELYNQGFRIFWVSKNMQCTYKSPMLNRLEVYGCMEISFMRDRPVK